MKSRLAGDSFPAVPGPLTFNGIIMEMFPVLCNQTLFPPYSFLPRRISITTLKEQCCYFLMRRAVWAKNRISRIRG